MKPKTSEFNLIAMVLCGLMLVSGTAQATTYTWTQTGGNAQSWQVNGNWSGGAWPTPVSGDTVDFSAVDIANPTTLTLQADRTAEIWKFGDTSNGEDWTNSSGNKIILAGTTPTINVVNRTATLNCVLGGSSGFTKTGVGQLTLGAGSSSLSGDIKINAGTLYAPHAALGTGGLVFTGNSTFTKVYNTDGNMPSTMSVTVNPSVNATISGASFYYNAFFAGAVSGDTTSTLTLSPGGNVEFQFNNTANTFQGELFCNGGATADNGSRCVFKSLADSTRKIKIDNSVFRLAAGGVDMNFINRPVEILDDARIDNDSTSSSVEITIAQDLIATIGNVNKTLILSGVNTGTNTFAGKIGNSASGSGIVSLSKTETGRWILAGANTYSGSTTISDGTLEIRGSGSLGSSGTYTPNISNDGTLIFNSSATQTLSGVISGSGLIIKKSTGTLTLPRINTYTNITTISGGTLLGVTGGSCSGSAVTVTNTPDAVSALGVIVTNSTMQWTCASLAFKTNGVGSKLKFDYMVAPSTTKAPLKISGDLAFSGVPIVVVESISLTPGNYPLLEVGGSAPPELPGLSLAELSLHGVQGTLAWDGTGRILLLKVSATGTVISVR